MRRVKLPFWASVLALAGVAVLCGLGVWQLQRLAWKTELIRKLDVAYGTTDLQVLDLRIPGQDFVYGRVSGRFLADKAFLLGPPQVREGALSYRLIVPLEMPDALLLVDMGRTADPLEELPVFPLQGRTVVFDGLLRQTRWNAFTPPNNPAKDAWFRLDYAEIARAKRLDFPRLYHGVLLADRSDHKFDGVFFDDSQQSVRIYPPNDHMQYALFWFAMAGALAVIYVLRFLRP